MLFSILTATYNRAHTLPKVYESLKKQSLDYSEFEWLIMDDGSSDDTDNLVQGWIEEGFVNIGYFKQQNGGHHRALNGIIPRAQGKFSIILDSDDTLTPNGLERYLHHWEQIPEDRRHEFAGISALCQSETGDLIGKNIPGGILDSNNLEIMYIYNLGGDRKGSILTSIQQQYLYPEFEGEKFISDSVVWHKMGRTYKTRYVDEVLCITDYLPDGQTFHALRLMTNNAQGSAAYYGNILDVPTRLPFKVRAGLHAYYVRYALHAGYSWTRIIREGSRMPLYMLIGILAGPLFYLRDELTDAKQVRKQKKTQANAST